MDARAIGIFDSGLGGLSAAAVLEKLLPEETLIYFGDNRNVPYGTRTKENITDLACGGVEFLCSHDCKAVIIACGTVCANAMETLRQRFPVPIFGVIDAPCRQAVAETKTGRVAVIATEASVRSGVFEQTLKQLNNDVEVLCKPCQSLVTMVESGHFSPDDPIVKATVAEELAAVKAWQPDTMLLACTHFPLLTDAIAAEMGPGTNLISVSAAAVKDMKQQLTQDDALAEHCGESRWFTSGSTADFAAFAACFLGHEIRAEQHLNGESENI